MLKREQEFIQDMQMFLAFDVWHYGSKYIVAGNEYTLGECVSDMLNFDFDSLDKAYQDIELILTKTKPGALNRDLITVIQASANNMLDVLLTVKPYRDIPVDQLPPRTMLTDFFGAPLLNPQMCFSHADMEVVKTFCLRLLVLRTDLLCARLLYTDFLDIYVHKDNPFPDVGSMARAYENLLDDINDRQNPKQYTDSQGKTYRGVDMIGFTHPVAINYGVPPSDSNAPGLCEILTFFSPLDFVRWEISKAMMNGIPVKRCKCCERFFSSYRSYAYEYCDSVASGEDERTCRQIGALRSHEDKIKNDPVWAAYRRAYKKYHGRVHKKTMTKPEFLAWSETAKALRDKTLEAVKEAWARSEVYALDGYVEELNRL